MGAALSSSVWAADASTPPTTPSTSPATNSAMAVASPQSKAIEFARQAGTIAGVAKACGQDVTVFTQRVAESLDKLAMNTTDKAGAMLLYQQIAHETQLSEQRTQSIPCTKVLQDYRNLPIMQADYREKVIAQLNTSPA